MNRYFILAISFFFILNFNFCSPKEDEDHIIDSPDTEDVIAGDIFILKNNSIKLEFKKINNKLKLTNLANQDNNWLKENGSKDPIWELTLFSESNKTSNIINSNEVDLFKVTKSSSNKDHFIFQWIIKIGSAESIVYATVSLNNSSSLSEWNIKVDLPVGFEITDVAYPMINFEKSAGLQLITPSGWGAEYELDNISSLKLPLLYPSSRATVQLMCLKNNQSALYFSTHDVNANLKTFNTEVSVNNIGLSIETVASKKWNNNKEFSIPWTTLIGVHSNGWENAVLDWYRPFALRTEWGKKTLASKNIPEWLLNTDLWLHGGRTEQDEFNAITNTLSFFGNDTKYHWYYWSSHDFDTDYPDYFPARDNYDQIVSLIQQNGSKVMPYINGRLWDTSTSTYLSMNGKDEVVLTKNQQPYMEIYASGAPNAVVCPSSDVWRNILIGLTEDILDGSIQNNAIYFDQVASARALPCYNENHNHPSGGGDFWHYSNRKNFTDIRNFVNSDQIICTEQNAECYIDLFDLFLMGNTPMGNNWSPAPLFPLIYSDRVLTYGFYLNNPNDNSFRIKNALTLLWGAQLNGGRSVLYNSNRWEDNAHFLKNLKTFRQKHHDLFVGGRFLGEYTPEGDNPLQNIESWERPSRAVRGAKWISVTGKESIILINIDNNNHEVYIQDGQKISLKAGEALRIN